MPFEDCYGSVGDLTFYHRDGKCYYRKRSAPVFPGTLLQMEHQEVHLRALAAWRELPWDTQKLWNKYARLGDEHVPDPMPWEGFPPYALQSISGVTVEEDVLMLDFNV